MSMNKLQKGIIRAGNRQQATGNRQLYSLIN